LTGRDERAISGTSTADAIHLIDGVLVDAPGGSVKPGEGAALSASERDLVMAEIYIQTYGPRIASTLSCEQCGEPFDIDFLLMELVSSLEEESAKAISTAGIDCLPDGTYRLADGRRFRLPTGEDEYAALRYPPEEVERRLLESCLIDGEIRPGGDGDVDAELQGALEAVAPLLSSSVEVSCFECGLKQRVRFDLQQYLLRSLLQEQLRLVHEIHRLASSYGWSLDEILDLPRSQRRQLARLADEERHASRGVLR
jgi:hypothetical protein